MLKKLGLGCAGLLVIAILGILGIALFGTRASGSPRPAARNDPPPEKTQAEWVDPRKLAAEPSAYRDHNLALYGKALTVDQRTDYTWIQLMAQPPGATTTESIVVELRPKDTEILRNECYALFGIGGGTQRVTRTLTGASNDVPVLRGYAWEPSPPNPRGSGCAP